MPAFNIDLLGIQNFTIEVFGNKISDLEQEQKEPIDDDLEKTLKDDEIPEKIEPRVKAGEVYKIGLG